MAQRATDIQTAREISPRRFEDEIRSGMQVTLIDVRPPDELAAWQVNPGAGRILNIGLDELAGRVDELRGPVRVICARGNASARAAALLADAGIAARSVRGGMVAWSRLLRASPVDIGSATEVVQFRREARGCLSYLVARDGDALVVDPAPDVQPYLDEAARLDVRIARVLDTHIHADHVSGGRELVDRTGAALHLSAAAVARGAALGTPIDVVSDGARIELGGADLRVVSLPGHTTDNIGVLIDARALIAGDSLFADAVARPDLEAGDAGAAEAAATLHRTLHDRVLSLPQNTLLLPCHYPGGRMDGAVLTSVGEAGAQIALLRLDQGEFVRTVVTGMPPRPANHLAIIAANLGLRDGPEAGSLEIGANNCAA